MKEQNYSNHTRFVPAFHFGVLLLCLACIAGSAVSLYRHWRLANSEMHQGSGLLIPALLLAGSIALTLVALFARSFALKAQDRAIRAEENLRYFAITGNLLDNRLTLSQVIALRFAPNNEMLDLAHMAAEKRMSSKEIKQAIKTWKADHHRV